jgi:hypothetical protein
LVAACTKSVDLESEHAKKCETALEEIARALNATMLKAERHEGRHG